MEILTLQAGLAHQPWENPGTVAHSELTEGERLTLRRVRLKLSRKTLSKLAGVSVGAIFRAEHDQNVEVFTKDAITGALEREERKRPTSLGLEGQAAASVDSDSSSSPAPNTDRRSAALSATLHPVTSPDHASDEDVLTEDEKAMLSPLEQSVIRRLRQMNPIDQERADQLLDVLLGKEQERAKGSTGTFDPQPARFRTR